MTPTLGHDLFSLAGIPSDIEAMHKEYQFGFYQLTNGMSVNIMARLAWPVYSKYYGGYAFFNPVPDGNWLYQSFDVYAEESARLFVLTMGGHFGGTPPMIDIEYAFPPSILAILFPNDSSETRFHKGNKLFFRMLKIFSDTVESLTKMIPVFYTNYNFWTNVEGQVYGLWAKRNPLLVATYPYDNYADPAQYLAAITDVMVGKRILPPVVIPLPWTEATWQQFTGRAPVSLLPGYAKESTWAKTFDMCILLKSVEVTPPPTTSNEWVAVYGNPYIRSAPTVPGYGQPRNDVGILMSGTHVTVDSEVQFWKHIKADRGIPAGYVSVDYLVKV